MVYLRQISEVVFPFSPVSGSPSGRAGRCQTTWGTSPPPAPPGLPPWHPPAAPPRAAEPRGRPPPPAHGAAGSRPPPPRTPPAEPRLLSAAPEPGSYQRALRGAGHQQQLAVKLPGAPEKGIGTPSRRGCPAPRPAAAARRLGSPRAPDGGAGRRPRGSGPCRRRVLEPAAPAAERARCWPLGSSREGRDALLLSLPWPGPASL